jgi:hydrogenase maturation protease
MLRTTKRTLLIGIGNYGRSDDALGWNFADVFASHDDLFDVEYRYQLQIEDAELVSQYEEVIFADASHEPLENGFSFYECTPQPSSTFTTHQLEPEMVLWLCNDLYGKQPRGHVMAISGVTWELQHGLSENARENFNEAVAFFMAHINNLEPEPVVR